MYILNYKTFETFDRYECTQIRGVLLPRDKVSAGMCTRHDGRQWFTNVNDYVRLVEVV